MRHLTILIPAILASTSLAAERPNVLFIAVDDLKPILGCYGDPVVKTPNIDRLAGMGTTFLNSQCQQAVCGPTRASLLTGLRPDTTKVWDLKTRIRAINPDVVTLPQYFKQNGYEAVGMGKIFDPRSVNGRNMDDPKSWSRPYIQTENGSVTEMGYANPATVARIKAAKQQAKDGGDWENLKKAIGGSPSVEIDQDVADNIYEDGTLADKAVEVLRELSGTKKPFFLAVGFHKPHLPFIAPKKYADLYDRSKLKLASFQKMPEGAPGIGFQDSWELKNGAYSDIPQIAGPLTDDKQRELIHGYLACVSYMDAQVGKVLKALDETGAASNTIVVFWGDHGWHLGDHGMWCKHTNFEQAARAPLIIAKRAKDCKGATTTSPVEFLDIYPTLCDLAGLPKPAVLQGKSLVPILDDPKSKVKDFAVSQFPRGNDDREVMGYSFRDERYRYIRWVPKGGKAPAEVLEELYDYAKDPDETRSFIKDPDCADILKLMRGRADAFLSK